MVCTGVDYRRVNFFSHPFLRAHMEVFVGIRKTPLTSWIVIIKISRYSSANQCQKQFLSRRGTSASTVWKLCVNACRCAHVCVAWTWCELSSSSSSGVRYTKQTNYFGWVLRDGCGLKTDKMCISTGQARSNAFNADQTECLAATATLVPFCDIIRRAFGIASKRISGQFCLLHSNF